MTTTNNEKLELTSLREKFLEHNQHNECNGHSGQKYWRRLEELADSEEFKEFLAREVPQHASALGDALDRRYFLKIMGASMALAGLTTACNTDNVAHYDKIVPYVKSPEEIVPGKPLFFATAMTLGGIATPLLVESHTGRPTKVEGNTEHPASLGATDLFAQASILSLYDPDRSQNVAYFSDAKPWDIFVNEFRSGLSKQADKQGAGIRILTETVSSPTLAAQIKDIQTRYPQAVWYQYEPIGRDNVRDGARLAFGEYVDTIFDFSRAKVILTLDGDFTSPTFPGSLRYMREFSAQRQVLDGKREMNRLYAVEPTPTGAGSIADHRLPIKAGKIESFTRALAAKLSSLGLAVTMSDGSGEAPGTEHNDFITALCNDLIKNRGASIVMTGDGQPPVVHALVHRINQALGNVGNTISYIEPVEANPVNQLASLKSLVHDIDTKQVDLLMILGGNPVFTSPVDINFKDSLNKVAMSVHLASHYDETSAYCRWHVPESHYLEAWGDTRVYDGTVSIVQPLIAPLYNSRSAYELLALFAEQFNASGYDIIRNYWRSQPALGLTPEATTSNSAPSASGADLYSGNLNVTQSGNIIGQSAMPNRSVGSIFGPAPGAGAAAGAENKTAGLKTMGSRAGSIAGPAPGSGAAVGQENIAGRDSLGRDNSMATAAAAAPLTLDPFERAWRKALHDGFIPNTASKIKTVTLTDSTPIPQSRDQEHSIEIIFRPDPTIHDGSFANNGWLQELPKPLSKLTWDNAALMSPATAKKLGVNSEDLVELKIQDRKLTMPVWILVGHANDSVTVYLGYGRERAGKVGNGAGFNTYSLRGSEALNFAGGLEISKTDKTYKLATTQHHHTMEGRRIVRSATLEEYIARPDFAQEKFDRPDAPDTSIYQSYEYKDYSWGMVINTNSCVGCNACVVACQAENNIPIVGKEEVTRQRAMHWIRIDRYYHGEESDPSPEVYHQPVLCMQCETAPCEVVCPVEATSHDSEGLNNMTYNRCVGTRYCSNNCPYKVRRFNFFQYADYETPSLKLGRNPNVTVRSRGVMEKCTYCVQRINSVKIDAEIEDRPIRDGEIVTACQAACPTNAIVFGNINDPESRVSKLKKEELNYGLLAELNTRPRTTYLGALRNPNPDIKSTEQPVSE